MKRPVFDASWPRSWQRAYQSDCAELWGSDVNLAYTYYYQRRVREVVEAVQRYLEPGSTVLDMAAAHGNVSLTLAETGYQVTWNDLRDHVEGYVRLKYEYGVIAYAPGDVFALRSSGAVPGSFDGVVAAEVIEHVAHPDALLREVQCLLRPRGYLFLSTPNARYVRNRLPSYSEIPDPTALESMQFRGGAEGHLFLLTNAELVMLAGKAGLALVWLENVISPVLTGEYGLRRTFRFVPRRAVEAIDRSMGGLPRSWRESCMVHTVAVFRSIRT
jgi:2-polyprenyl-6-hydroxyphenyl methylase/3-demethylubiquinone-9 3-methyltransferase